MSMRLGQFIRSALPDSFRRSLVPSGITLAENCALKEETLFPQVEGLSFQEPITKDALDPCWKQSARFCAGKLWHLEEGSIATSAAAHITPKGELIWDLSEDLTLQPPLSHPQLAFKWRYLWQKPLDYRGRVVSLVHCEHQNPYHWLLDGLARLALVQKREEEPFDALYLPIKNNYQRDSLKLMLSVLGLKCELINALHTPFLRPHKGLIVPSFALYDTKSLIAPPKWGIDFLREKLPSSPQGRMRRIYITRADASYRKVINEDALLELLSRYGFERVVMSELSFAQQCALFASSEAMIAPHGAALVHLLFAPARCKVLELFCPHFTRRCYWELSSLCDLDYAFCLGEPLDRSPEHPGSEDIFVDLEKVKNMLQHQGMT